MKLEELKDVLIDDCRDFGVPQERMDRVFSIIRVEKITAGGNDVFSLYRDENGYFLVYWEKGHPVGGITATNPDDFRFAFQCYNKMEFYDFPVDKTKKGQERVREREKHFMSMMAPKFGDTLAYQKTLSALNRIWEDGSY